MPLDFDAPVRRNVDLGHGNFLIEFDAPEEILGATRPGQFFMIGIPGTEVLLRRPFSACGLPGTFDDASPGAVQVLYRVYGRATGLMAALKPGARLQVLGPLGNGFEDPSDADATPVFVAGGIGSAAFPCFAARLSASGRRPILLYGARSKTELPLLDWFEAHCARTRVATDDGSLGREGLVTAVLEELLLEPGLRPHLYACGPTPMLKSVARIALAAGVPCDLALEAPMACGFGVCLGCVVPCHAEGGGVRFERCCVEGPVMPAARMAW